MNDHVRLAAWDTVVATLMLGLGLGTTAGAVVLGAPAWFAAASGVAAVGAGVTVQLKSSTRAALMASATPQPSLESGTLGVLTALRQMTVPATKPAKALWLSAALFAAALLWFPKGAPLLAAPLVFYGAASAAAVPATYRFERRERVALFRIPHVPWGTGSIVARPSSPPPSAVRGDTPEEEAVLAYLNAPSSERAALVAGMLAAYTALIPELPETAVEREALVEQLSLRESDGATAVVDLKAWTRESGTGRDGQSRSAGRRHDGPVSLRYEHGRWRVVDIVTAGRSFLDAVRAPDAGFQVDQVSARVPMMLLNGDRTIVLVEVRNEGIKPVRLVSLAIGLPRLLSRPWWPALELDADLAAGERRVLVSSWSAVVPLDTRRARCRLVVSYGPSPIEGAVEFELHRVQA